MRIQGLAALGAATLLLSSIALWNGFPLIYPDTLLYLKPLVASFRTPFYSFFALATNAGGSLWPIVLVQGLLTAWLLCISLRAFFGRAAPLDFLCGVAVLTLGSSLPWFTGQLMPDIASGWLVLCLALLLLVPDRLSRRERFGIAGLGLGALLTHQSHLGVALVLIATGIGLRLLLGLGRSALLAVAWSATPVLLGVAVLLATNAWYFGQWKLSLDGASFVLANAIQRGPALEYLRESCPERGYALCPYLDELPWPHDGQFLWSGRAPFRRAGGFGAMRQEAREIVRESLRARPAAYLRMALQGTARQLMSFGTGVDNRSYLEARFFTEGLGELAPDSLPSYLASRQSRGEFPNRAVVWLHHAVFGLSLAAGALWARRRLREGDGVPAALLGVLMAALLANAALMGTLSGVHARYQSRLAWLPVFFAVGAALVALRRAGVPRSPD